MLSLEQKAAFEGLGVTRLPGAIAGAAAEKMCGRVWDDLAERLHIVRDDPTTWTVLRPSGFRRLERSGAFAGIASSAVRGVFDELLGAEGWEEPPYWGQPLVSFPDGRPWHLPHKVWHFDLPVSASFEGLPGVQIFAFLSRVAPGGGGTLVVTGSHRIAFRLASSAPGGRGRSAEIRKMLARSEPWFRELGSPGASTDREARLMHETTDIGGVPVRVVELTGEPGDVALMHPWMLHAPAPNGSRAPRIMVTHRLPRRGLAHYWI
jgi:hypothetical protein